MKLSRIILTSLAAIALPLSLGCSSIWHNMQPHRLMKLNNGPAPSSDPEFTGGASTSAIRLVSRQTTSGEARVIVDVTETAAL